MTVIIFRWMDAYTEKIDDTHHTPYILYLPIQIYVLSYFSLQAVAV